MRLLLLMLFALASTSCSHAQVRPSPPEAGCLPSSPPQLLPVQASECPEGSDAVLCFDKENAVNLVKDVQALQQYAVEAYTRCGPAKE